MPYEAVPCRFARPVGWAQTRSRSWGTCHRGHHHATVEVAAGDGPVEDVHPPDIDGPFPEGTPCEACGAPYLEDAPEQTRSSGARRVWDTPSGRLEPGCLYWSTWRPHDPVLLPTAAGEAVQVGVRCWAGWTNCDGRHLEAVLPDGVSWDVDGRANNCALPDDTTHRCWVRKGDPEADPPTVHVSKDGETCAAGAGSIATGTYHGWLQLRNRASWFSEG